MIKYLVTFFVLFSCVASAQTIKSLGYNTNGQVVYSGSNLLTFTNDVMFNSITAAGATRKLIIKGDELVVQSPVTTAYSNTIISFPSSASITMHGTLGFSLSLFAANTRVNLGLGATWLTNTDVTNFRTAIGLGSAATNAAAAFQPASANLTNLASNNGSGLTNIPISGVTGVVALANGGTGATNATNARANLGFSTNLNTFWTATNAASARSQLGAGTGDGNVFSGGEPEFETVTIISFVSVPEIRGFDGTRAIDLENFALTYGTNYVLEWSATEAQFNKPIVFFGTDVAATTRTNLGLGSAATNAAAAFQPASANLTNLASNNAANLTNLPALLLRTNGSAAGLTNFPTLNQTTTGTASNVTGVVALNNGGTGTNSAGGARTNLQLGWLALTNPQSSLYSGTATQLLGYVAETNPSGSGLTGFNVMAYTNTNTLVIPANLLIAEDAVPAPRNARNVTVQGSVTIQAPYSSPSTIYANNSITATDGYTYTNTLLTWSSNAATFSNVTATGTLGVSNTAAFATNVSVAGNLTVNSNVEFRRLRMIAANAADNGDDSTLWLDTSGTNASAALRLSGTGGGAEKYNAYLQGGSSGLTVSAVNGFRVLSGPTAGFGSVLFSVNSSGNATLNGTDNLAPSQTTNSASSLMTRGLSDTRFYPLASFWLPAEEMQSFNSAGAGNPEWTPTAGIMNMVTPFGRSPRTVAAVDANGRSQGIYTIPIGWPAGAQVRVTTYLALFNSATTNTFNLYVGGYWTTNTNIISPVVSAIGSAFEASSLLATNVTGTGATNEYFKISNTFSFATNANRENRQVFVARFSTATNDTATNTIYFIGSQVELLP
jgi:hypothetical protein